jgi:two-component system response regulator FixJ
MSDTVSIIDDEASVRDAVGMLLETNGYATASFASVGEFLDAPFAPGAIVSDVRMPETTGLDLVRKLQSSDDPRPVILLTGHGDIEMAVQALKLGAFDFIEKPFDLDRLLAAVKLAMETSVT